MIYPFFIRSFPLLLPLYVRISVKMAESHESDCISGDSSSMKRFVGFVLRFDWRCGVDVDAGSIKSTHDGY